MSNTDYDAMSDNELLTRCAAARREMELARAHRGLGADHWDEDKKMALFMRIFHPDHGITNE